MKHWPFIALSLLAISTSPLRATADSTRPDTPELTGSAPDFQYLSHDGRWRSLHDLRSKGHVLLVFETTDAQLAGLEREADSLRRQGVIPMAVLHRGESANWSAIERLGLSYSLLSDPEGDLASQFQAGVAAGEPRPAWCLVDRDGRVCALDRDALPESGFAGVVELALQPRERASAVRP